MKLNNFNYLIKIWILRNKVLYLYRITKQFKL